MPRLDSIVSLLLGKVNPMAGWDFWGAAGEQVATLRARYGIPETPGPVLLPAPGISDAAPSHDHA